MKTFFILFAFILTSGTVKADNRIVKNISGNHGLTIEIAAIHLLPADPCLNAALNAQNQAFAFETSGWLWCMEVQSTGPGYTDCANAFTVLRQQMVAYIQSTFVPCPSGMGYGII